LTAGVAAAAAVGFGGKGPGTPTAADLPPATVRVTRQTVLETTEVTGELGYRAKAGLPGRIPGVLTRLPLPGDVIHRGQPVYTVDNTPVILMYGNLPAYRALGTGLTGPDVRQLEQNLTALGYGGYTVDDRYTAGTAAAVKRWQKALGLEQTGQVEQGRVLFASASIRIDSVGTQVNQSTGGGQEVLQYTGTGREVTALLDVADQRLARRGVVVQVQLPGGQTVTGRVERVATVVEPPTDQGGQPQTQIQAIISVPTSAATAGIEAAAVTVVFTAAQHPNVLTVPVAALVALAEGGYGVEVVEGSTTHFVKVETGLFADGRVEVTGDGLNEGTTVGIPQQ
jgi:membrane fusion protein, multidrug efflux system